MANKRLYERLVNEHGEPLDKTGRSEASPVSDMLDAARARVQELEAEVYELTERIAELENEAFECTDYQRCYLVGILKKARESAYTRWDLDAIDDLVDHLEA